jgi:hypothetical protein
MLPSLVNRANFSAKVRRCRGFEKPTMALKRYYYSSKDFELQITVCCMYNLWNPMNFTEAIIFQERKPTCLERYAKKRIVTDLAVLQK